MATLYALPKTRKVEQVEQILDDLIDRTEYGIEDALRSLNILGIGELLSRTERAGLLLDAADALYRRQLILDDPWSLRDECTGDLREYALQCADEAQGQMCTAIARLIGPWLAVSA